MEIKFEINWNFENYLRIGVLKIKFKNWSFGNKIWKKLEFWKLNLRIGVLEIKFERNLRIGVEN